jgi:hypothetical protein
MLYFTGQLDVINWSSLGTEIGPNVFFPTTGYVKYGSMS